MRAKASTSSVSPRASSEMPAVAAARSSGLDVAREAGPGVAEGLAARLEGAADERAESLGLAGARRAHGDELDDGARDLGRRVKCARAARAAPGARRTRRARRRVSPPQALVPGRRREALRDLVLHHEDGALEVLGVLDRQPEERARDRVRQVPAEDAGRARVGRAEERREVDRLRVPLEHAARTCPRAPAPGAARDRDRARSPSTRRGALGEQPRERAGARADLDDARAPDLVVGDARAGDGARDRRRRRGSSARSSSSAAAPLRGARRAGRAGSRRLLQQRAWRLAPRPAQRPRPSPLRGAPSSRRSCRAARRSSSGWRHVDPQLAQQALAARARRAGAGAHRVVHHFRHGAPSLAVGADPCLEGRQGPAHGDAAGAEGRDGLADPRATSSGLAGRRRPDVDHARARLVVRRASRAPTTSVASAFSRSPSTRGGDSMPKAARYCRSDRSRGVEAKGTRGAKGARGRS